MIARNLRVIKAREAAGNSTDAQQIWRKAATMLWVTRICVTARQTRLRKLWKTRNDLAHPCVAVLLNALRNSHYALIIATLGPRKQCLGNPAVCTRNWLRKFQYLLGYLSCENLIAWNKVQNDLNVVTWRFNAWNKLSTFYNRILLRAWEKDHDRILIIRTPINGKFMDAFL